jgi:type III restriction enzyme
LEQERRLASYVVEAGPRASYHFELHNLTYKTRTAQQDLPSANGQVQLFTKGYVDFESQPVELERTTVFAGALDDREYLLHTKVHYSAYSVDEVVQRLHGRLMSIDTEAGTTYADDYPAVRLREILEASLARIGERRSLVSEQNLQHAFRAMGNTRRVSAKTARIERDPDQLFKVSTRSMRSRSTALSSFNREATVFFDSLSGGVSLEADTRALAELTDDDSPYPKRATSLVDNVYRFKSPVNVVLTTHEPERRFTKRLFEPRIADRVAQWVKSPDTGFYEIAFTWRKGDHTKQGTFNPDLFLRLADSDDVIVVELKDDGDASDENKAKYRYAQAHFEAVNALQSETRYTIKFVSPESYDGFFQAVQDGTAVGFVSALQATLAT